MLTISRLGCRSIKYYNDTASHAKNAATKHQAPGGGLAEYYTEGETRVPSWLVVGDKRAVGAATGLAGSALEGGDADTEVARTWLDDGRCPNGATGRHFTEKSVHGFDLTFAAPKSVSRTTCQCCAQGRDAVRETPRCCSKAKPDCCNAVLSASSIRHILRVLRAALQDAVDEELLSRDVAKLVQLRVTDERRVRSFSRDEALRFLQAAGRHRLYALWAVALAMGLRRGEALGLAWADVDLDGGRLTVRQALHRIDGQLRLDPVKTDASIAVLPIPVPLVNILRAHRQRQLRERVAAGSLWRDTGLVFTTAHGGFIEPRNANRMFHNVCTKANVPQLRVHDLRHSCATLLFTMGVQQATVQRILRHSSITVTTGTYVEVIEAVQRDALDSMGSLFGSVADPGLSS